MEKNRRVRPGILGENIWESVKDDFIDDVRSVTDNVGRNSGVGATEIATDTASNTTRNVAIGGGVIATVLGFLAFWKWGR